MQGYGPITVTQNTVVGQTVDQSADRILLSNRSIYDVLVSFQVVQPTPSSVLSPQWPVVVHAGDQIIYTLRNADRTPTPLGTYWQGNIWLCATAQQSGLVISGTGSTSTQFWITALSPGDPTPVVAARPVNTDLSSQPRTTDIAIPHLSTFYTAHSVTGANLYATNFAYGQRTSVSASIYLHWFTHSIFTAGVQCDFQLGPIGFDASLAVITNSFASMAEFQPIGQDNLALSFPSPLVKGLTFGAVYGAQVLAYIGFAIKVISVSGAGSPMVWSAGITIDTASGEPIGVIGNPFNTGNPAF